ncbi:MAG TPA: sigma-70 family RNA polymerase sigma factor [Rhizomicrobium sp.]|nr:sigma-70 family RNA polymerase sigma factor [Rhizomicrobium sp.]
MADKPQAGQEQGGMVQAMPDAEGWPEADRWFLREVLPLEASLMLYLSHNWDNKSDLPDLRQEVYARVCEAAQQQLPLSAKSFLFATARNLLIDLVRHKRVVQIEAMADLETLDIASEQPGPEREVAAREDLRAVHAAIRRLPPRCQQTVVLRKVEGLTLREIGVRMNISEKTVERHLTEGLRVLADVLYGESRKGMKR